MNTKRRLLQCLMLLAHGAWLPAALAASSGTSTGSDPTRPPPGFNTEGRAPEAATEAPLLVNSVFLMGKKPYAVVDGMTVKVGDKLGTPPTEARITRIDERGVWLGTGNNKRLLTLTPDVQKAPSGQSKKRTEKTP